MHVVAVGGAVVDVPAGICQRARCSMICCKINKQVEQNRNLKETRATIKQAADK